MFIEVIVILPSLQRQDVTGWTIRAADYTNNVGATRTFAEKGGKRWIEYVGSDDSKPMFTFVELNRNEKGVYLHDASREVVIHLDLEGRKVMFRQGNQPFFSMYDIQRVR